MPSARLILIFAEQERFAAVNASSIGQLSWLVPARPTCSLARGHRSSSCWSELLCLLLVSMALLSCARCGLGYRMASIYMGETRLFIYIVVGFVSPQHVTFLKIYLFILFGKFSFILTVFHLFFEKLCFMIFFFTCFSYLPLHNASLM